MCHKAKPHQTFSTSAGATDLSLGSTWQQVPSGVQDFSEYSGWSTNIVVWVVLIFPLISYSSSPFSKGSGLFQVYLLQLVSLSLSCSIGFLSSLIGLAGRVFANGLGDLGSISGRVIPKTLKMVLDTSLLNTQQ